MPQEVQLPRPVSIQRRGGWTNINSVTSPLSFAPSPNEFFHSRSESPTTVLAGPNNFGKSLLLRLLKAQDTERAVMIATDRFYQMHYLALGDVADEERLNQYRSFYSTFESPVNNDKSNVQLQSLLQALTQAQFDQLGALFKELLDFELQIRSSGEDRPLSNRYIEVGGTTLQASSTGTRLLLLILAACADARTEALYIDEPELGLAPQLQRVLATTLFDETRRRRHFPHLARVVVTTHSPLLLDRAVLRNNFMLTRSGDDVTVVASETVADLHALRFAMLGDSLDALFLPEAIVIVEGKCDQDYIGAALRQRFPQSRITVVEAGNDDQVEKVLHVLSSCLGPLPDSPLTPRIWCVLDQLHRHDLPAALVRKGVLAQNIVTWTRNGIEYLYPDQILRERFRAEPNVAARMVLHDDVVTVDSDSTRKSELSSYVKSRITSATVYPPEMMEKLLTPLNLVLNLDGAA